MCVNYTVSHKKGTLFILGITWSNVDQTLQYLSRDIALLVRAFIVYVRPILEYNPVVWSPQTKGDIAVLENVQRRYTERLAGLRHFSYKQCLV